MDIISLIFIQEIENLNNYEEVMILEKDLSDNEKKYQVIKIYKQFDHASIENIKKLINRPGFKCNHRKRCTIL